jgi:hypothetical protein
MYSGSPCTFIILYWDLLVLQSSCVQDRPIV